MAKELKSANPFLDDDDEVNDYDFVSHPHQGQAGYMLGNSNSDQSSYELKRQQLLEERRRIEERTLQSTNSSVGLLHESEQVGISTAEELVKQRDQLHNIEENLDFITNTMRTSQKHINAMKSYFGGIKGYFTKGKDASASAPSSSPRASTANKLDDAIDHLKSDTSLSKATNPAARIRNLPYDDARDEDFASGSSKPATMKTCKSIDEKIEENIDFMSLGLGRLKNLAIGLNDEIELQNEMIDKINDKTDKADETLASQNRQIKRILKK